MALDTSITLPCDVKTQICNCTKAMDSIYMNSSQFTPENFYKCGFFTGLNINNPNGTTFTTYNADNNANVTGWYCGKGEDKIYGYSNDYSILTLYRCGYNAGKDQEESIKKNDGGKITSKNLFWVFLALIFFSNFSG
ncbi:hypothetical protein MOUN0_M05842 [Monosporozyma unispora]